MKRIECIVFILFALFVTSCINNQERPNIILIMATAIDAAGAEYPKLYNGNAVIPLDGISLMDAAMHNSQTGREAYFCEHGWNRYIRKDKWKLVSVWNGDWELYDMEADRTELNDLTEKYPELVKELKEEWEKWAWRTKVLPK